MADNVDPPILLKLWVTSDPESVHLVCLLTHRLDHLLTVWGHEQGNIEQNRVGDLANVRDRLANSDVCHGIDVVFLVVMVLCGIVGVKVEVGSPLHWQYLTTPSCHKRFERGITALLPHNLAKSVGRVDKVERLILCRQMLTDTMDDEEEISAGVVVGMGMSHRGILLLERFLAIIQVDFGGRQHFSRRWILLIFLLLLLLLVLPDFLRLLLFVTSSSASSRLWCRIIRVG